VSESVESDGQEMVPEAERWVISLEEFRLTTDDNSHSIQPHFEKRILK